MTEQTEITEQTEKILCHGLFRLFRYFRLFRHLHSYLLRESLVVVAIFMILQVYSASNLPE